jgi:flagellar protein FliS
MNMKSAVSEYTQIKVQSTVDGASPSQLITLLLDGALERVREARWHMQQGNLAGQGELIGKAIDIVASLDSYLDHDSGADVAHTLESLYDYLVRQLYRANQKSDVLILDEVASLLSDVRVGWVEATKNQE